MARNRLNKPLLQLSMVIMTTLATTVASTLATLGSPSTLALLGTTTLVSIWAKPAQALEYTDKDLMLKDFEQMEDIVFKVKKEDSGIDDADESRHQKGKDALFIVLSRRDRDGSRGQLVHNVQADLDEDYYSTVTEVGQQALKYVSDSKISVAERSTYLMVIENILSEFRPQAKDKLKALFTQIRDANVEPDDDIVRYRVLKMSERTSYPSKTAAEILKRI